VHDLIRLFRKSVTLFLVLLSLSFFFSFFIPAYLGEQSDNETALRHRAELRAVSVDKLLTMYDEYIEALGSRTQIRGILSKLRDGTSTLEETQAYTGPRYQEGAAVYRDLLYATRLDYQGRPIAEFGQPPVCSGYSWAPSPRLSRLPLYDAEGRAILEVIVPILDGVTYLGADYGVFDLSSALQRSLDFPEDLSYRLATTSAEAEKKDRQGKKYIDLAIPLPDSGLVLHATYQKSTVRPKVQEFLPIMGLVILGTALLVAVAYLALYRGSAKLIGALEEAIKDRENTIREANHRIKNNLNMIVSLVELRAVTVEDEGLKGALDSLEANIRSVALIHERLQVGKGEEQVELRHYLGELIVDIGRMSDPSGCYNMRVQGDSVISTPSTAVALGFIVSELAVNAIKYALGQGDSFIVTIRRITGGCVLTVENEGKVFPQDKNPLTTESLGMTLVREYMDSLDGSIAFEREPRTTFTFTIPDQSLRQHRNSK